MPLLFPFSKLLIIATEFQQHARLRFTDFLAHEPNSVNYDSFRGKNILLRNYIIIIENEECEMKLLFSYLIIKDKS
jgi:hypothetical protein